MPCGSSGFNVATMSKRQQFRHQDIATVPAGYKVRTVHAGKHEVRIAFPKKGSGQIVSILHPKTEKNPDECGALLTLAAADVATLAIPIDSLGNGFGSGFESALTETGSVANPTSWQDLWEQFKEKVKASFHPGAESNPSKRGRKSKKNLDEIQQAADLASAFKGSPAENVREIDLPNKQRDDFAHLGWLEQMVFHPPFEVEELDLPQISEDYDRAYQKSENSQAAWNEVADDHAITLLVYDVDGEEIELAASADGKQLYFLGGKQSGFTSVLDDFQVDTSKDKIDLGELVSVTYTATKKQAGDTEPRGYYHIFGEENGTAPRVYFDALNKRLFLTGGSYHLESPELGIMN